MQKKTYTTELGNIIYWRSDAIDPSKPWIIFLPGLTADHRLFDKQVVHFKDMANLLMWDPPSHGMSRPFPLKWTMEDLAKWLHQICGYEGIDKPILVGQSMGGYVAQAFMDIFPDNLSGFVSIDSCPLKRCYFTSCELMLLKHAKFMYLSIPWKLLIAWGSAGCATSEYGQALMRKMMESYSKHEYCDLAAHGYRIVAEAVESGRDFDISCPALLLCGTKDMAGSAKSYNKRWTNAAGIPLLWIEGAGHNSNTDDPEAVSKAIENFMDALS